MLISMLAASAWADDEAMLGTPNMVGVMHELAVSEISGLAVGRRDPDRLWAVNDSDHPSSLEALDRQGTHLGTVDIKGARNIDWEDLNALTWRGRDYLLIADIGDNGGLRPYLTFYLVAEPEVASGEVELAGRLDFRYADGPHDAEAVFVDEQARSIFIIAKRQVPAALYTLPLRWFDKSKTVHVARKLGRFDTIPRASADDLKSMPRFARYFGQATSAVADPQGRFIAVLTYRDAHFYRRRGNEPWLDTLAREPTPFGLPFLPQAEAMAYDMHSAEFLVTSESLPAPILSIKLPGEESAQ